MTTITNARGELVDMTTGEVVGSAEGTPTTVAPRQSKQNIPTQGADRVNGVLRNLSWGFNAGLFALPDLATEGIAKVIGMSPEETFTLGKYFNQGQVAPRNAEERYVRAIGEGVGAGMPFTGVLAYAAKARPMVTVAQPSAGILKGIANDAIKFAQEKPRLAAAIDIAFNAGYEGLRQAVTENVDDSNPNKALYEEVMPAAAFVGLPLAMTYSPLALVMKAGKKAVNFVAGKTGARTPYSNLEEEILRGTVDPVTGEKKGGLGKLWQAPLVNIVPRVLMKNAERKLTNVFGPIKDSPEAQEALAALEAAMKDPDFTSSGFKIEDFDVAERTMFPPLVDKKAEFLKQLSPNELRSTLTRNNENQEKLSALFDSLAPEARQPVMDAFKAAQAERQQFFESLVRSQKDLTDAEVFALSERLGPQNMDMINDELRGALLSNMEIDHNMRTNVLQRMGLRQATSPEGLPMPTRDDGTSLFPARDMEQGASALVNKYTPERPSLRNPVPEPIRLLREFIQSQQFARDRLEKSMVKQLTNQAIDEQIGASGLPKDIEEAVRSSVMALVQGKGGKGTKRRAGVSEIAKTDADGNVSIPTGIPNKTIVLNPAQIQADAALIAKANTGVDINVPEALDYLTAAARYRNDSIAKYNAAMARGNTRQQDAQRILDSGNAVYKDIEKLVLDHVPKIKSEYEGMKNVLADYNAGFEKNLPLVMSKRGPTGEFVVGNEQIMQRAFNSAENLRQLQVTLGGTPEFDRLLEKGAIDWLRNKNVLTADGVVDPKKIRQVLDKNRNIVEALPPAIQQKFKDEIAIADDYVARMGELDARRVAFRDEELNNLLKKVSRPDADPKKTLEIALKDPATMRVLVDELGKDPERLAALRRAVFDIAAEGNMQRAPLKPFIDAHEKSLHVLYRDTQHLENLKTLADIQRRVNAFADITGQMPAFQSLDQTMNRLFGSGIRTLTTNYRDVQAGRQSTESAAIALMVRLTGALENDIYKRIFTKALEDPAFAKNLTQLKTPEQGQKVLGTLNKIGVPVSAILPIAPRAMIQEVSQLAPDQQVATPTSGMPTVPRGTARDQLRALPPAPPIKFNLRTGTTPPPAPNAGNVPLMYPTLFPNDPISAALQQRQQAISNQQPPVPQQ